MFCITILPIQYTLVKFDSQGTEKICPTQPMSKLTEYLYKWASVKTSENVPSIEIYQGKDFYVLVARSFPQPTFGREISPQISKIKRFLYFVGKSFNCSSIICFRIQTLFFHPILKASALKFH